MNNTTPLLESRPAARVPFTALASSRGAAWNPPPAVHEPPSALPWLEAMLEEVDHGMVLVGAGQAVLFANRAARQALQAGHALALHGTRLQARHTSDAERLRTALEAAARRGLRCLLQLGQGDDLADVAVVPVEAGARDMRASLLLLGRSRPCAALSLQWYALRHGLTPAETQVLAALCTGESPAEIAARQGVALSTVRSHVSSARAKTGAPSIRRLCERVALLPPLIPALSACG